MFAEKSRLSRRDLLKWVGVSSAAAFVASCGGAAPAPTAAPAAPAAPTTAAAATKPAAAAATTAPAAATAVSPVGKAVTIVFASNASPTSEEPVFNSIIAEYKKKNPNVTIDAQYIPADQLREKLVVQLAAGTGPDILRQNDDEVKNIAAKGQVLDLTPYMQKFGVNPDDYFPLAYDDVPRWNGALFAVITGGRPECLAYNKEMLTAAGVPFPPKKYEDAWDWQTFKGYLPKLKKEDGGKVTQWPFADGDYWEFDRLGQSNGGEGIVKCDLSEFIGNQPTFLEPWQALLDLMYKDKLATPYGLLQDTPSTTMMANKQVAMVQIHSSNQPDLMKAAAEKGLQWDIAPMPKMFKKAPTCTYMDAFSVNKATKDPEAAVNFAFFLISDYGADRMMFGPDPNKAGVRGPTVPLLKAKFKDSRWLDPKVPPENASLWEALVLNDDRFPESQDYRQLTQTMVPVFDKMWANSGDPKTEMDNLKPKVDALLKQLVKEDSTKRKISYGPCKGKF